MSDTVYKLVHFKPFEGYEILGEYDTEEEAETVRIELLQLAPKEVLTIARVLRQPESAENGEKGGTA